MDFLPLFFKLTGKTCLVVGGGEIAVRKAGMLFSADAQVHVVSKAMTKSMTDFLQKDGCSHRLGEFIADDLNNVQLVIAATNDKALNKNISQLAHERNIPVNVVDDPALCSFILPAIVDRSPVVVAVSSGGKSPVLARLIRARLETLIPSGYGKLATLVGNYRGLVKQKFSTINQRREFWESVLQGPVAELIFAGKDKQAAQLLEKEVEQQSVRSNDMGEVYLVGGGPGDPDLLTFRALRLMQQADVVLYDRLVSEGVRDLCRRDAQMIHVGKARDQHTLPQEDISKMLVRLAKEGHRVCRLKGGDPFIFGRGGEEIELLAKENIPFQVVPGITAASGCAAYSGIPLTHRDYSQSVRFVTGHLKDGAPDLDWEGLIQPRQTLVFYMGLVGLKNICHQLIHHGLGSKTPIALIQKGTTIDQRVYTGTLKSMPSDIEGLEIQPPTLIIVGEVVKLHDELSWFNLSPKDSS
ncbi:MAG: uroporphyrinogen-III C-methyltransferase [Pseudomonadales bacterium]|nr:uroporphyrinogen-III C-methyltransferase [Pseudomonadales bacterium]